MGFVKTWIHDARIYQTPTYTRLEDVDKDITRFAKECLPIAKEIGADHFVYATKIYDSENNLIELNYYNVPLNDSEFDKRTIEIYKECICKNHTVWFGVLHKGTAY